MSFSASVPCILFSLLGFVLEGSRSFGPSLDGSCKPTFLLTNLLAPLTEPVELYIDDALFNILLDCSRYCSLLEGSILLTFRSTVIPL